MNHQTLKLEHNISASNPLEGDLETLIDQVWNDLQGLVSRTAVQQALLEIIPEYEDATITTFVPIFIRRDAVDILRATLAQTGLDLVTEEESLPKQATGGIQFVRTTETLATPSVASGINGGN